ncbi:MAG: class I SAM-dependent methyltransferase [Caldilineaceae bacterium]|nr:class I SAM-dependent methyltransferase [Caldilineaceae bacterium]
MTDQTENIGAYRPTERFSDRVDDYVRYRPRYPAGLLQALANETGLTPAHVIADVGCGPGISSGLFVRNGNPVYGVEPNGEMRAAAARRLTEFPNFTPVNGTAEATALDDDSVDYVISGQAFHWFDRVRAQEEFRRILRPGGRLALFWNTRQQSASPFMAEYEALVRSYSPEYDQVTHERIGAEEFAEFFGPGGYVHRTFENPLRMNFTAVMGRTASTSYTPPSGTAEYAQLETALRALFDEHAQGDEVPFIYVTDLYTGKL